MVITSISGSVSVGSGSVSVGAVDASVGFVVLGVVSSVSPEQAKRTELSIRMASKRAANLFMFSLLI